MNNFQIYRPTEFLFGKDTELQTAELLKKHGATKVLVHYGGGSVIKSGLLGRVEQNLKNAGITYELLGGVVPNPHDTLVYEGVELCKRLGLDFILAIGGGSVIDSAKAISLGALYDGDFWDFWTRKAEPKKALKIGTILTIPAAGSEASNSAVITKVTDLDIPSKRGLNTDLYVPTFSILNPELHYTLPPFQTACGIADMLAHVMERYFTNTPDVEVTDRLGEALMLTIINMAPIVMADPQNYAARANLAWAGALAHNGTCGVGRVEDWATHRIEHELSAVYDVAHGAGLAVLFPVWMKYVHETNLDRFAQFAKRVFGIDKGDKKASALEGIEALAEFFKSIGLPTNFAELGAKSEDIDVMIDLLREKFGDTMGAFRTLTMDDVRKIYEMAV